MKKTPMPKFNLNDKVVFTDPFGNLVIAYVEYMKFDNFVKEWNYHLRGWSNYFKEKDLEYYFPERLFC